MTLGPPLHVALIVQARMGASRLPGKPLMEVLGRPLLSYLLERLKRSRKVDSLIVATTQNPNDDPIAALAKEEGVQCVRGSEEDVLSRYAMAARYADADLVVRITADCPLVDPMLIDNLVEEFELHPDLDYLSNTLQRSFPRGMDVEIVSRGALEKADREAKTKEEREHVTLYLYRHPERFKLKNISYSKDHSKKRWTVDTPEDFALIRKILEAVYPVKREFSLEDLLELWQKHPEWEKMNHHIEQKGV